MSKSSTYDLEERTLNFAIRCRLLVKELASTISNAEDGKQLIKSSGSIGVNYIDANEKLGPKDFVYRLKIGRKEAKESIYWLGLLKELNSSNNEFDDLLQEGNELRKILSAIIQKVD